MRCGAVRCGAVRCRGGAVRCGAVQGWCERLIDIDESDATPFHFRPVLTKGPTLAEL